MISRRRVERKSGFTLVEVMVVVGVIALLVSLSLPAVQSARESARRAQCKDHLRQLMIGTQIFVESQGGFPPYAHLGRSKPNGPTGLVFSQFCLILPYLEQQALAASINFDLPANDEVFLAEYQLTAAITRVGCFLCPSDPTSGSRLLAPMSYRGCQGSGEEISNGFYRVGPDGLFGQIDDPKGPLKALSVADVRDGCSTTLAYSEKPIGSGSGGSTSPFRDYGNVLHPGPLHADQWLEICRTNGIGNPKSNGGSSWLISGMQHTQFDAVCPPNSRVPDCGDGHPSRGAYSARSYHPGGVNAAMADGSVRAISETVAPSVWRAISTRSGGETVQID